MFPTSTLAQVTGWMTWRCCAMVDRVNILLVADEPGNS
jgi:hypothetical protein